MSLQAVAVLGRGLTDPDEPVLHADDGALIRGRAAFETMRVYGGRPFKLAEHLERLAASSARIGLPPVDRAACEQLAAQALAGTAVADAALRIYWTAGRENSAAPSGLALVSTLPSRLDAQRARGLMLISLPLGIEPNLRAVAPWLLGGVKSTSYAVNMAAEQEAQRRGADDALFLASGEIVLEGPVTNMWWRRERTLFTPELDLGVLAGVTRETVIELAPALGYELREGSYPLNELAGAEEAFTSSSLREIMPVVELDGAPIGSGEPGATARELQAALRAAATR